MILSHSKKTIKTHSIIPCFSTSLSTKFLAEYTGFKKISEFKADQGETYSLLHASSGKKVILIGLGKEENLENITPMIRKAVSSCLKLDQVVQIECNHLDDLFLGQAAYGAKIAFYDLQQFKENKDERKLTEVKIISSSENASKIIKDADVLATSSMNVMDLVNMPSNIKTPYYLADYAVKSGKQNGFSVKVFRGKELEKENLHATYAVGKASENQPSFIIMEYKPKSKSATKIGLVGKGVSFDTGGISIKPSANMAYMKCDMAGGAAVIGMMEVAAKIELPYHIIGIVPAAENTLGGNAFRPGDIISSYSGKSIEVIDTDAEGRLLLADGLSYMVKNYRPDIMVDLATLTGSCVATLGYFAAGMFTQNDELGKEMYLSGIKSGEKVWRLPMWDEYKPYMNSDMADIKNLSSVPVAGATTAAKFLELFTEKHENWIHLDIAGVSFTDGDIFKTRTATAYGVRLLTEFITRL